MNLTCLGMAKKLFVPVLEDSLNTVKAKSHISVLQKVPLPLLDM
jgi:hypothetical protein